MKKSVYVIRKGEAYWTGRGWRFHPHMALTFEDRDGAKDARKSLGAEYPAEGDDPAFTPRVEALT